MRLKRRITRKLAKIKLMKEQMDFVSIVVKRLKKTPHIKRIQPKVIILFHSLKEAKQQKKI